MSSFNNIFNPHAANQIDTDMEKLIPVILQNSTSLQTELTPIYGKYFENFNDFIYQTHTIFFLIIKTIGKLTIKNYDKILVELSKLYFLSRIDTPSIYTEKLYDLINPSETLNSEIITWVIDSIGDPQFTNKLNIPNRNVESFIKQAVDNKEKLQDTLDLNVIQFPQDSDVLGEINLYHLTVKMIYTQNSKVGIKQVDRYNKIKKDLLLTLVFRKTTIQFNDIELDVDKSDAIKLIFNQML